MKIISIRKKEIEASLPDGNYVGVWGGYFIDVKYKAQTYSLETQEGIRGFNINVIVSIKNGIGTFELIDN